MNSEVDRENLITLRDLSKKTIPEAFLKLLFSYSGPHAITIKLSYKIVPLSSHKFIIASHRHLMRLCKSTRYALFSALSK